MSFNNNSWASQRGKRYMQQPCFCQLCKSSEHNMCDCPFNANSPCVSTRCDICGYLDHRAYECPCRNSANSKVDQLYASWENQASLYADCSDREPYFEEDPEIKQMLEKILKREEALEAQKHTLDNMCAHTKIPETQIAQEACLFEFDTEMLDLENSPCDYDCFEIEPYVDIHESHIAFDNYETDLSDNLFGEKFEKIEIENPSFDFNSDFDVVSYMVESDELDKGLRITNIDEPHCDLGDIFEINDVSLVVNSDSINSFSYDPEFDSFDDELFVGKHEEINEDLNNVNIDESHHVDVLPISIVENFDLFEKVCFIEERHEHYYDDPMLDSFDLSPFVIAIENISLKKGLMILLFDKHRKIIKITLSGFGNFDLHFCIFMKATSIMIYMNFWIFGLVAKLLGKRKCRKLYALYFGTDSPAPP